MEVTVIIATMNEEEAIAGVIKSIPEKYKVLVVDNSTDSTPDIAESLGARVVKQEGDGKGDAMVQGAQEAESEVIVFADGDGTYPMDMIGDLVRPIARGQADAVNGAREFGHSMKLANKIGNHLLSLLASALYSRTSDLLTGMRAMRRADFLNLGLESQGFEIETEIHIKSHKHGLKTIEVPIPYKKRVGETKLNRLEDGFRILRLLLSSVV